MNAHRNAAQSLSLTQLREHVDLYVAKGNAAAATVYAKELATRTNHGGCFTR